MELILLENVQHVGRKGDVVSVRDGYARNFLIPRSLATPSTRSNKQFVEEQRKRAEKRRLKEKEEASGKAEKLEAVKLTLEASAGESEKLFGSITAEDISQALAEKGHAIDKKKIYLKEPIRTLGSFKVSIEIYPQVKAALSVEVIRKP